MNTYIEPHYLSDEAIDIGRVVAHACFDGNGIYGRITLTEEELAEACAMTVDEVSKPASKREARMRMQGMVIGLTAGGATVAALAVLLWMALT
jgi:hypothetical protein